MIITYIIFNFIEISRLSCCLSHAMKIISVRENPEYTEKIIRYFQQCWPTIAPEIYADCIANCLHAPLPLPQWYVLQKEGYFIGCAGLITNDFISRMDLYPWICAVYVDEKHRGNSYSKLLIDKAKKDAKAYGFQNLYLCTDHIGLYEKFGFNYLGKGFHPWGETSRIYQFDLSNSH